MTGNTSPYRICTALAVLVGGVFLVFTHGTFGSISGCPQDISARTEAAVGGELETESLAMSLGRASSTARLSSYPPVSGSIPECGPGPVQNVGSSLARLVRLTEQDDWGTQSADPPAFDWAGLPSRFASIETLVDDQRAGSSRVVSRAQGTLEAVRSVVLRL